MCVRKPAMRHPCFHGHYHDHYHYKAATIPVTTSLTAYVDMSLK